MRKSLIIVVLRISITIILIAKSLSAGEADKSAVDENAIFGDEKVITSSDKVTDNAIAKSIEKESLTFTGFLNSRSSYSMSRDWVKDEPGGFSDNELLSYFQSNFSLDARLRKGIKGYVNASLNYYPLGTTVAHTSYSTPYGTDEQTYYEKEKVIYNLEEIFADINFNKQVYFRMGKQVIKWGTGYLWTPSDLINIEKKNILDPSQVREGVYGIKMHIPFGTRSNIYSFINLNDADNVNKPALALKYEHLLGNTEISVSALFKKHRIPVYGCDFSSRLLTLNIHGEASASYGDLSNRINADNPVSPSTYKRNNEWVTRASIGLGRGFEFLNIKDRIRIDAEFFYNGSGYSEDIFNKNIIVSAYFAGNNLYEPNYYGMYYAGVFGTFYRLFVQDLDLSIYYIKNLTDYSSVTAVLLNYNFEYNVTISLMTSVITGRQNREYTALGNAIISELMVKLIF